MTQVEDGDDVFGEDDMTSMAHTELEEHRELREYARIAAWDMPSLSGMLCLSLCLMFLEIHGIMKLTNFSSCKTLHTSATNSYSPFPTNYLLG